MNQRIPAVALGEKRVGAFVDGQNYYHAISRRGLKPDLDRLVLALAGFWGRLTLKVFATGVLYKASGYAPLRPFLDALRYKDWNNLEVPIRHSGGGRREKEVDVRLALRMVEEAQRDSFDVALLLSGDRDFVEPVERMRRLGKYVVVAQFQDMISPNLARAADEVVLLDSLDMARFTYRQPA